MPCLLVPDHPNDSFMEENSKSNLVLSDSCLGVIANFA